MKNLIAYMEDHLAGSVAALELLDHLIPDSAETPLAAFFIDLRADIEEDQDVLRALLLRCGEEESGMRKVVAWFAEKVTWAKFRLEGTERDGIGTLQALEVLLLGITGKKALWRVLAPIAASNPPLQATDFAGLIERADNQIERVDEKRINEARKILL